MDIKSELGSVTDALAEAESELAVLSARVAGLKAQKDALEIAMQPRSTVKVPTTGSALGHLDLSSVHMRTDAIVAVLEHFGRAMGPAEIRSAMAAAGRDATAHKDNEYVVAATLAQMNDKRTKKVGRAQYMALSVFNNHKQSICSLAAPTES